MSDLRYRNIVPNRLSRPRDYSDLVTLALDQHLDRVGATPDRDLLLGQFALPFGPMVRASARRRELPYAVHLRGDDVWIWPHQWRDGVRMFADAVRGVALVLSVSEALLREARRLASDDLPQGVVVANGIDLALFRPADAAERVAAREELGVRAHQAVVLCVAAAIERKGWRELFAALSRMSEDSVVLIAITTGGADLDLRALKDASAPGIELITRHDIEAPVLARMHHAADVFCLPSHGEGMSNAVLEALASGLPVITTPVGGHPEVVDAGVDGLFVPVRDVGALERALRELLGDPGRRATMGRAARRRAETIGTPHDNGARVATLLHAALDRTEVAPALMRSSYALATRD